MRLHAALRRGLVAGGLVAVVLGVVVLAFIERALLFPRYFLQPDPQAGVGVPGLERLWLESPEGPVEAWFLPGDGVSPTQPGPMLLFAHGNGELIEDWPAALAPYRQWGVSVVLAEYRGYGRSAGSPTQAAITEDFVQLVDTVVRRGDVDPGRLVFHGRSLGGAAVCALAARRPPTALILESTFTSVTAMARQLHIPPFFIPDPFDSLAVVQKLTAPLLVIHGRRDSIVPFAHGEALSQAAPTSELAAFDADHNDGLFSEPRYWQTIERYLRAAQILRPAS